MQKVLSGPFFSIIIPSYNSASYIGTCLEQCRRQTFRDFELVITDDASSDDSVEVIRRFIGENPEMSITFLPSPQNHGIGYSKGLGLRTARGQYVVFHDSDDWMDDDFLEQGHKYLSGGQLDKLRFRIRVLNAESGKSSVRMTTPRTTKWTEGMFHATFFRRDIFVSNGIEFNESRNVMEDLYVQTAFNYHCTSFLCVPEAKYTLLYRENSTSGFRNWSIERRIALQRETLEALGTLTGSFDAEAFAREREDFQLLFIKQYYFMILQYSRLLPPRAAQDYYGKLRDLQREAFPGYLRNRKLTLIRDNGEPFRFRAVIFLMSLFERTHVMKAVLWAYVLTAKLVRFQTK